ncbi:uncharacterized protein N7459_001096 [Penicillium hispanicum]|uniref:uncharacterized protein n=1 Tax=Penicillium hispanicum TaxID=1080232 RepID=UPI00253FD039|nr:uncharacterized protein N7459_001096 [Penicillium hispanicum]KAJ5594888.1 hypothetical protein N7459_001096 [Penicillium hispanicum]
MPLQYDPDFHQGIAPLRAAAAANGKPDMSDPLLIRKALDPGMALCFAALPEVPGVGHEVHQITSDGQSIPVHRFWKLDVEKPTPAVVHAHGGGMVFGNVTMFVKSLSHLVKETGVQIFSVEYRLAPEHPYPIPFEDSYASLTWLYEHAAKFSIDPSRIGVFGESAGANLAASMALMARDRGLSPPVAKQLLVYPMLDDRDTRPFSALKDVEMWSPEANITCWSAYLGADFGTDRVSQYAAPARAASVEGLPATYIEIGNLDIYRDTTLQYASRIAAADIELEFHMYEGLPHCFDVFVPFCAPTQKAVSNRIQALAAMWH